MHFNHKDKYFYKIPSQNSEDQLVSFKHPFLQGAVLYVGELLCLGLYYLQLYWAKWKKSKYAINEGTEDRKGNIYTFLYSIQIIERTPYH